MLADMLAEVHLSGSLAGLEVLLLKQLWAGGFGSAPPGSFQGFFSIL